MNKKITKIGTEKPQSLFFSVINFHRLNTLECSSTQEVKFFIIPVYVVLHIVTCMEGKGLDKFRGSYERFSYTLRKN